MNIPQNGGWGGGTGLGNAADGDTGVGMVAHAVGCGMGLVVMGAVVGLFYAELVTLTRPLHVLSSTALVFTLVLLWLVVWFGIELALGWRKGLAPVRE